MAGVEATFSGNYGLGQYSKHDLENVAKYALGTTIVAESESPFQGMGIMMGLEGLMGAFKVKNWLAVNKQNNIKFKEAWANDVSKLKDNFEFRKANLSRDGYKSILEYSKSLNHVTEAETALMKLKKAEAGEGIFNKIKSVFSKKVPTKAQIELAEKAVADAKVAAGAVRTGQAVAASTETLSLGSKVLKCAKSSWLFSAITGATEIFTQVIPAFSQLGAEKGLMQLGKSALKTAAVVGGWEAGAAAGAAIGTLIFPGAGTLVGAIVGSAFGVVGGCLGSWALGKLASPLTKSELEIAKEKQAEKMATEASKNPESAQKLIAAAQQKINQEGTETEDAKVAFGSLKKLAESAPKTQTQQASTSGNPYSNTQSGLSSNNIFETDWKDRDIMTMNSGLLQR